MPVSEANVTVIHKMDSVITLPVGVAMTAIASGETDYDATIGTFGVKVKHEDKPSKTLVLIQNTASTEATVYLRGDAANERLAEDIALTIPASSEIGVQINTGAHKRVDGEGDDEYVYITGTAATIKVRAIVLTY